MSTFGYVLKWTAALAGGSGDVIEAIEGPISLNVCVGEHPDCFLMGACGMNRIWAEGQRRVMDLFENTTIAQVRQPQGGSAMAPESPEFRSQGAV